MARSDSGWTLPLALGALAVVVAAAGVQPWGPAMNDPDSMSSVLYFQRLAAGHRLEVTVLTTPKPLLTLVQGLTWTLTHDWRALVWETVLVHGMGVALLARLAARAAGAVAAAAVAVMLIASASQLQEVSQANSLVWSLAAWAAAGVAATAPRPRYWLAGVALAVGGMARHETWVLVAVLTVLTACVALISLARRAPGVREASTWPSARELAPLLVGWIAVPVQLLHDLLLSGDALYWSKASVAYTALVTPDLAPVPPVRFALNVLERYAAMPLLVALALIGVAYLVVERRWAILLGLGWVTIGIAAMLGLLSWRAVYVTDRYFEQPTLGLVLAAAIGLGALAHAMAVWIGAGRGITGRWGSVAAALAAGLIALALVPPWPMDAALRGRLTSMRAAVANLESVMPRLRDVAAPLRDGPAPPPRTVTGGFTEVDAQRAGLVVPRPFQRRIAIDLDLPLTVVADSRVAFTAAPAATVLQPGQWVFHDAYVDTPPELFTVLEVDQATRLGGVEITPVEWRAGAYWLLQVARVQ